MDEPGSIVVVSTGSFSDEIFAETCRVYTHCMVERLEAPGALDDRGDIGWLKPLAHQHVFVALPSIYLGRWRASVITRLRAMRCVFVNIISPRAIVSPEAD